MSMLREEERKKTTTSQYIFSLGLFAVTFLMWLFWDASSTAVILTGGAALTVIINRYQKKEKNN